MRGFQPSNHVSSHILREIAFKLQASVKLHPYIDTFPNDPNTVVACLDIILLEFFNAHERAKSHKDILVRRGELITALRLYNPMQHIESFAATCAIFFKEISDSDLAILNDRNNILAFLRSAKEGRGGSLALNKLIGIVENKLKNEFTGSLKYNVTFQEVCTTFIRESAVLLAIYEPMLSIGFSYNRIDNHDLHGLARETRVRGDEVR